jgi:hypothetical protein
MALSSRGDALPSAPAPDLHALNAWDRWLLSIGVMGEMAVALAPVLHGGHHSFDSVRGALKECAGKLAATISHGATLEVGDSAPWAAATKSPARQLVDAALETQLRESGMQGARLLFAKGAPAPRAKRPRSPPPPLARARPSATSRARCADGLPPEMWGVSKHQFSTFVSEVRAAHLAGEIRNLNGADPSAPDYYPGVPPRARSHLPGGPCSLRPRAACSREIRLAGRGPQHPPGLCGAAASCPSPPSRGQCRRCASCAQVVGGFIKPLTACFGRLPGASYAVMRNLWGGGLRCSLFISHGAPIGLGRRGGIFLELLGVLTALPSAQHGTRGCTSLRRPRSQRGPTTARPRTSAASRIHRTSRATCSGAPSRRALFAAC